MVHRLARRQRLPQAIAALALAGGLVGCSGTPFGDQLARSFSPAPPAPAPSAADPAATPPAATVTGSATRPAATPPASGTPAAGPQPGPSPQGGGAARSAQTGVQQTSQGRARPVQGQPAAPARPAPAPPAPYRITLRLPGADPSAPAEAVTEALRAAGLSFEVEMIERVRTGTGAAPTATPAPPPR
jgi:hypothetical protein